MSISIREALAARLLHCNGRTIRIGEERKSVRLVRTTPQGVAACSAAASPPTLPVMGGPSESTIRAKEYIAAAVQQWARAPFERAENKTAARLVDLWEARRKRGAEPLFSPSIGAAICAGRPWLAFYCPGCQVVGEIDLRRLDRHRDTPVTSLIPLASCKRCAPHPPFARLIGLR